MRLPSGRGMAASYQGIWLVNLYAPSGTANRQEREDFYNVHLVYLLRSLPPTMLVGGDFNCFLSQADCTGNMNYSNALDKPVRGLELTHVWAPAQPRAIYTHYTPHGVARLDRLYVCLSGPTKPQNWRGNCDGSIHRSPGDMPAYNRRCTTATTRSEKMENEWKATGGGTL